MELRLRRVSVFESGVGVRRQEGTRVEMALGEITTIFLPANNVPVFIAFSLTSTPKRGLWI